MSISSATLPYQEFCSVLKFMRISVHSTFFSRTTWHFIQWLFNYSKNQGWNSAFHKCSTDIMCSKWPCLNKELDQMISRGPFQPQAFNHSVSFPCQQFIYIFYCTLESVTEKCFEYPGNSKSTLSCSVKKSECPFHYDTGGPE